jgi:hypothetical protein
MTGSSFHGTYRITASGEDNREHGKAVYGG